MSERSDLLLTLADDELIVGWRDSEWTGVAPTLEEDVAFSSIAQNEIGHARALYELAAAELGTDADALAFDREPGEYLCAPLVELRLLDDWALTIARRYLYEEADRLRIGALMRSEDRELAGLAGEDRPRGGLPPPARRDVGGPPARRAALRGGGRRAVAVRARDALGRAARPSSRAGSGGTATEHSLLQGRERGSHTPELAELWEEMTEVRRSVPGAQW